MRKYSISSAIDVLLDNFIILQKDIANVTGLYHTVVKEAEQAVIKKIMLATDRNKTKTAKVLGISRNTLDSKIKSLKIEI